MVSKQLLAHKSDRIFIIGKGIFDDTAAAEYAHAELFLGKNGFDKIVTASMYKKPVDPENQTDWYRWVGRELLNSDALYINCTDKEIRTNPFVLYSGVEWCRELAHSVKIPVFFKEYEENDGV